jgi:hypothetical protein
MTSTTDHVQTAPRSRWIVLPGVLLAAGAIAIRFAPQFVMMILVTYGDDVLVAFAAYLFIGAACRKMAGWRVLLISLALLWSFQVAELFHPAWMGPYWARLRFEWSDMASFAVGAGIGFGLENILITLSRPGNK